jgi:UDP-glucose 4-epimerase
MERAGVRRLVLASSLSVYDWGGPGDTLAEGSALEARPESRDGYTTAKLRQEQLAREACRRSGTALAVIRPGAIWGRGREYPSIIGQRAGPLHFLVAAGRQLPVVHVENCADAFAAVAEAPGLEGTFNLLDHPDLTVGRFVADHLRRSGRFGLAIPVAYRAGLAAVRLIHALSPPALRRRLPSFVGPARFAARYRPLRVEAGLLRRASGWSPPLDYAQCLERTYGGPAAGAPAGGRPGLASP